MSGLVSLVGAGPGDPEYLTRLGERRLKEADVVFYDRLVAPELLRLASQAQLIDVGKLPYFHKVKQGQIEQLLIDYAQQNKRVVRLKAGDPYVFGRGGEEGQHLAAAGITFEVVPGLTSALAGLAAAGIPITHRDYAASFHVITGHRQSGNTALDWANIAAQEGTLVFLMGMSQLHQIVAKLRQHGKAATTPVAVIQWATQWNQRVVTATLATIINVVRQQKLGAPSLIVVGAVVKLRSALQPPNTPLTGKHLLIPAAQSTTLTTLLRDQGAFVDHFNRSTVQFLPIVLPNLQRYQTLVVTDMVAFTQFKAQLLAAKLDLRVLAALRLVVTTQRVAVGLRHLGLLVDAQIRQIELALTDPGALFLGAADTKPALAVDGATWLSLYRHVLLRQNQLRPRQYQVAIFTSTQAVNDLFNSVAPSQRQQLRDLPSFAFGEQVTAALLAQGVQRVYTSQPSYAALLTTLTNWLRQ
ncbi:uroporphyrinogen-III C-methyltransferase [Loigolactobacillus binensis]|uniref:uroporphyrinogen-III C-methyltransferase n=1 Tax=Loigolactobacillus binensis TaxID=2559922 RepID=A0ABW3ECI8_9LACO|nr:uroporphyrinogen-III C-methyltransferase [Loigolactobacillus binensis]